MTMKFDKKAKKDLKNSFDFGWLDTPVEGVKDMIVREVTPKFARGYIATHHYTKTFPDSTKYCFAGYLGDKIAAIITYGMGTSLAQYTSVLNDIKQGEYLELTRLWSADTMPKNTESKIISESMRQLPSKIKLIITYADPSRGHIGYIYQATNAHYIGESSAGSMLVAKCGTEKHPRLIGIYKKRNKHLADKTTQQVLDYLGWSKIKGSSKYKYVYLRGNKKTIKANLKKINRLPYPKLTKK